MEIKNKIPVLSEAEFKEWGNRLYGEDAFYWKFKCPVCGNIQTPRDLEQHKDRGATPNSAYTECIGRYMPDSEVREALGYGDDRGYSKTVKSPCNYAIYGLFQFPGMIIIDDNGKEHYSFPFADMQEIMEHAKKVPEVPVGEKPTGSGQRG